MAGWTIETFAACLVSLAGLMLFGQNFYLTIQMWHFWTSHPPRKKVSLENIKWNDWVAYMERPKKRSICDSKVWISRSSLERFCGPVKLCQGTSLSTSSLVPPCKWEDRNTILGFLNFLQWVTFSNFVFPCEMSLRKTLLAMKWICCAFFPKRFPTTEWESFHQRSATTLPRKVG